MLCGQKSAVRVVIGSFVNVAVLPRTQNSTDAKRQGAALLTDLSFLSHL